VVETAPIIEQQHPIPASSTPTVTAQAAFHQLNRDFGVPLDPASPTARVRVRCREDNLARGWWVVLDELNENGRSRRAREQVVGERAHAAQQQERR